MRDAISAALIVMFTTGVVLLVHWIERLERRIKNLETAQGGNDG